MDTLDGFILNLFRTERPNLTNQDFDSDNVWVCDLLNQSADLANEYIKFRLGKCKGRIEKLQFLYSGRSCFMYEIEGLKNELNPEYHNNLSYYRGRLSIEQMEERLAKYQNALSMTDKAICYYIDCSKLDCGEFEGYFKLSEKKGTKIDIIRVFNALYEMKLIEKPDGQYPSKAELMEGIGNFFGSDFSKYHINLSQALKNQPLESNLKVFDEMINITKDAHYST